MKDSNEVEVLAILEALRIFSLNFQGSAILESDLPNAISWMVSRKCPWKLHFLFNEIKEVRCRFITADPLWEG